MRIILLPKMWVILLFIAIVPLSLFGQYQCESNFTFYPDSTNYKKINFNSNSTYEGNILEFEWTFGDEGSDTSTLFPFFEFQNEGEHEVCLRIKTDVGCENTFCQIIHVGQQIVCGANFNDFPAEGQYKHTFENKSYSSIGITYSSWDMGDGTYKNGSNFTYQYASGGTYDVCLVIGDSMCLDTLCRQIYVSDQNNGGDYLCQAEFGDVQDSINHRKVTFYSNPIVDTTIHSYNWFVDGQNIGVDATVEYEFANDGNYNVCHKIVTKSGCTDSICRIYNIEELQGGDCYPLFNYSTQDLGNGEWEVSFVDSSWSSGLITSWEWNLSNGEVHNVQNPTVNLPGNAIYDVCLKITSNDGCQNEYCTQIQLGNQQSNDCYANFNDFPAEGQYQHTFENQSYSSIGITYSSWDMGDGTYKNGSNFTYQYASGGTYDVCLVIGDSMCLDTLCKQIYVSDQNNVGEEELDPIQGCMAAIWAEKSSVNPSEYIFRSGSASATGDILNLIWDISGNNYSGGEVIHKFTSNGEKKVTLTASNNGCSSTAELTIKVGENKPCAVSFVSTMDTSNSGNVQFALSGTSNLDGGFWQFGDGMQSEERDPVHYFSNPGFYNVCVTAWDSATGCQIQHCIPIEIEGNDNQQGGNCFAQFDYEIKQNGEVHFTNRSQGDFTNVHYSFGDGGFSNINDPSHFYTNSGVYEVCVNVFDSLTGCVADYCSQITVLLDTADVFCHADFDFFPAGENKFTFANHSTGNFTDVKWELNGGVNVVKDFEMDWEFDGPGHHEVCLTVFDSASGCFNTMCKYVEIVDTNVSTCKAEFSFFRDASGEVRFNNESAGAFTDVHWTMGDGAFLDDHNFGHMYDGPGHYEVCLSIFDTASGCQDMICKFVAIEPDSNSTNFCQAKFDRFIDDNGVAHANNLSTGDYTNSHWDFGDGYVSYDMSPSHEFATSGFYKICLNIFDSITGCQSSHCEEVNIVLDSADVNCFADFNFIVIDGEVNAENVSVGDYTHGHWSFGDGGYADGNEVAHIYNATGVYDICLDIWDSISGCQASVCKPITIQKDTQDVYCGAKMEFMHLGGGKVEFMNRSFGSFTNIHWSLGNGDFRDDHDFMYEFKDAGHYEVCIAIADTVSGCQDRICEMVVIAPDTAEVFCEARMDGFIDDNGLAHASNQSVGIYTHSHWDFGDGTQSFDHNPSHTFEKSGYYYICLNIFDSISGCQSSTCDEVDIQLDSADINCSADFDLIVIDGEVTVKNTSIGNNMNAHWAFGDGGYANGETANHYYNATGIYDICLAIWDSVSGCQAHVCKPITILKDTQDVYCEAAFEHMPLANGEIQFKDASVGAYTHVKWDLGNGVFADHADPIGNYPNAGVYPVTVMIWDSISGCQSTYTEEIAIAGDINQVECHAKFEFFPVNDSLVKFKSVSQGDYTNIHWEFGDGNFAEGDNELEHVFPHGGFFNVCVGIYDSLTGCHDFVCDNVELLVDINVIDCHAEFEFFPTTANEVTFNNISAGHFTNAFWKFSDGSTSYDMNPTINFGTDGLFGACLTVFDSISGCQDEFCVEVPIIEDNTVYCDAHFGFFVDGKTVKLEPEIKGDITGWVWDYGDGFNSNDSFPTHTFHTDGVYDICLTVFDSTSGCFNTYCDQVSILTDVDQVDEYVQADFSYYLDPADGMVHFKDESVGNPDTWYWDFGDGDSAGVSQDPTYAYMEDGFYEVCLTVKNANGGQETRCEVISVGDVSDACFAKFDYYANAVTATAHFDNKSLGRIDSYEWDFGDSITSIQYQPSHSYADTGFYPVCLTITNDSGCVRTFCKEIRVGNSLEDKCIIGCVWPGDANLDLEANHYDILPMGLHYGEVGPSRDELSSDWRGHESQDWSGNLWGDVNNKHGDANGDGIIDLDDIMIVEENFAYSHPWQPRSTTVNQLSIDWDVDDIDVGETAVLTVSIPDTLDVTMYGLGFEIDLDSDVFDYATIVYDFSNSWLGTENDDLVTFGFEDENLGEIYIAETRNDHEELTGNGELVKIYVQAKANSSNTGAVLTTEGGVTAEGDTVEFNGAEDAADINSIEEREGYLVKDLVVFPNPTKDNISFSLPVGTTTDYIIEVLNNVGALIYSTTQSGGGTVVQNFEEYNSGIYTIQVSSDKVKYMQKVVVVK